MSNFTRLVLLAAGALLATNTHAEVLLEGTFSKNIPFGPFLPNEVIELMASITNISPDHAITVCEGACIGDSFTYSLGAFASIPNGYSFYFGNVPENPDIPFDGQASGVLLPGEEKDFVYSVYTPIGLASPGLYPFGAELQIFAATAERPMLANPSIGGNWEVLDCSPFPGGGNTGGCFPGPGPFPGPEPATVALLGLAMTGLAAARLRRH